MNSHFDQEYSYFESNQDNDKSKSNIGTSWLNEIILEEDFPKFIDDQFNQPDSCQQSQPQEVNNLQDFSKQELITKQHQQEQKYSLKEKSKKKTTQKTENEKKVAKKEKKQEKEPVVVENLTPKELSLRESSEELSDGSAAQKKINSRQFNSEEEKLKYLKRRMSNNLAAKNSRKKKQEKEEENTNYLQQLILENKQLREDLLKYQTEALVTRQHLSMVLQSVSRNNVVLPMMSNPYVSQPLSLSNNTNTNTNTTTSTSYLGIPLTTQNFFTS